MSFYALMVSLHDFFAGATCALSMTASLLFLRFYRKSADRLFLFFAAAFAILGINQAVFMSGAASDEHSPMPYLVRLVAFALILYAIIDKNGRRTSDSRPS